MTYSKLVRSVLVLVLMGTGITFAAPQDFGGGSAVAKPPSTVKHCKVRPTPTGKLACAPTNESGGDASLDPGNNRLPPSSAPNYGTAAQNDKCFYACTHGPSALSAQVCEDSCYGGR